MQVGWLRRCRRAHSGGAGLHAVAAEQRIDARRCGLRGEGEGECVRMRVRVCGRVCIFSTYAALQGSSSASHGPSRRCSRARRRPRRRRPRSSAFGGRARLPFGNFRRRTGAACAPLSDCGLAPVGREDARCCRRHAAQTAKEQQERTRAFDVFRKARGPRVTSKQTNKQTNKQAARAHRAGPSRPAGAIRSPTPSPRLTYPAPPALLATPAARTMPSALGFRANPRIRASPLPPALPSTVCPMG